VHVGLPGLTSPTRLLRFGLRCGVGASLKVLRQQAGGVLKLATTPVHHPDATLVGIAAAVAADPASLLRGIHFFPFGALAPTAAWANDIRDGRFEVDDRDRLRVTA
jgi:methylenetetrahydrofolate reductase (NADPH)